MKNINEILKEANLYSIEYTGFFSFKFSLSDKSKLYSSINELIIEFNNGYVFYKGDAIIENKEELLNLFGLNIINIQIENEILIIDLESNCKLESISSQDELIDRNWVIRSNDSKTYIINDSNEIFHSSDLNS